MKAMIVDDEEVIRLGLVKILSKLNPGIEVIGTFSNGQAAWEQFESLCGQGLDLVITDIKMPRMDGIQLIKNIRQTGSGVDIIVLSGFEEFDYVRAALRSGVKDYLLKPIVKSQLEAVLQEIERKLKASEPAPEQSQEREHHAVEMVKETLKQSYGEPFELDKLADIVGMNGNYLSRLFKNQTNMTITDYLIHLRIEKAKELLSEEPSLRNYEVAQLVGYHDPVYFNKLFKKMVGVTPKDFKGKRWPGLE
ncbi:AraC family two component transcriptional regulator [Paenibacillus sp. BK033]|uniref:response regulator transcription factor n=1 Tax=Paenibacillus sp. BK033 TaxID=2512133 RepID=UPI00104A1DD4|nr:response regulator [Paenibacillus sp. BK033]TCM99609.1 AraC family two component transcriptional regulator [Paenibacillus sp. BK033]